MNFRIKLMRSVNVLRTLDFTLELGLFTHLMMLIMFRFVCLFCISGNSRVDFENFTKKFIFLELYPTQSVSTPEVSEGSQ